MKKILFVCTGNTCRSPMAEVIFNALAKEKGLDWRAESAGFAVDLNEFSLFVGLTEEHAEILMSMGIPADLVRVLYRAPNVDDKYDLRMDIVDPYGGDLNAYRKCRDDIVGAVKVLITSL